MRYLVSEIAEICGGRPVDGSGCDMVFSALQSDRPIERVITDSRGFGVDDGTLFVALRGPSRDGHAYMGDLYKRGVRAFLVERVEARKDFSDAVFIVVPDTLAALQALAAHYRGTFRGKVVGVTGSWGKTTVKEQIAQLTPLGVTLFRSPKSYNSQIGVPLSVLMASGGEDYVVIEAGISRPGEMALLQRIIRPDVGILTCVGGAHEENFASKEQLAEEKTALFSGTPLIIRGSAEIGVGGSSAALAVEFWRSQGYEISAEALASLEPVAMRLEIRDGLHNSLIVNDTYHSDLNSLAIALDYLGRVAGGRPRVVIMPENEAAAVLVKSCGAERCIQIGPGFTVDDLLRTISPSDFTGRAILIKGGARLGFDHLSRALESRTHTTVVEVDLDAILDNLRLCRSHLGSGVGVIPMVKAGGYGHGTDELARTLQTQGVDYLAVAFADEGIALREGGITMPIVVLNADEGSFEAMIRHRLEPEIYNFVSLSEFVRLLKRHGEHRYPIHLKLDTGMHRLGFRATGWAATGSIGGETCGNSGSGGEIRRLIGELAAVDRWARVATIFSHLAAADDPAEDDFTRRQIADFDHFSSLIAASLPYPVRRHLANTMGIERFPEAQFDLVRLGLGLYGFGLSGARQAATLKTRIVDISHLAAGETVGYNRRGVLDRPSVIATIPIGYADGLDRRLSGGEWSVLVGGEHGDPKNGAIPAPIVGNICMDSCMIDVTDAAVALGAENITVGSSVVVFSPARGNTIDDMARTLGTIPYEIMTSISSRVKRIYTKE